jgi:hypothetical protein
VAELMLQIVSVNSRQVCDDPISAVLVTMRCIDCETQDAECAAAGYNPDGVIKIHHNGEPEEMDRSLSWFQLYILW